MSGMVTMRSPLTTVAVIENASRTDRKLFHGVLQELPALEARDDLDGPVMVIIGEAVAGANFDKSEPLSAFARTEERASIGVE